MYTRDGSGGFNRCSDFPKKTRAATVISTVRHDVDVSEQRPSDVLGALPRRRPQRRSAKRADPAGAGNGNGTGTRPAVTKTAAPPRKPTAALARKPSPAKPTPPTAKPAPPTAEAVRPPAPARATARRPQRLPQPAQPAGVPPTSADRPAEEPKRRHVLGTAAQAAAELAEIGLSVSA